MLIKVAPCQYVPVEYYSRDQWVAVILDMIRELRNEKRQQG